MEFKNISITLLSKHVSFILLLAPFSQWSMVTSMVDCFEIALYFSVYLRYFKGFLVTFFARLPSAIESIFPKRKIKMLSEDSLSAAAYIGSSKSEKPAPRKRRPRTSQQQLYVLNEAYILEPMPCSAYREFLGKEVIFLDFLLF